MLWILIYTFASSSVLTARITNNLDECSLHSFRCSEGTCITKESVCDGIRDCKDSSDEQNCNFFQHVSFSEEPYFLNRRKRQSNCGRNKWQCIDGSCIAFDGKCDGIRDCPDGSDESHAVCRKTTCQSNWFRCTYGACVDGTAPCNGVSECADSSDEMQPKCFNETSEIGGQFKCQDGSTIRSANRCDGAVDCPDGSDETIRACAATPCQSYLFQCAYGACVDQGSDCDGKKDCADGSDEDDVLCNRISATSTTTTSRSPPQSSGKCKLPPYPEHGSYVVANNPNAKPGEAYATVFLTVTCNSGYGVDGNNGTYCYDGFWPDAMPQCVRYCHLNPHPSVEYLCQIPESNGGTRPCKKFEPSGTTVEPKCRAPNYYSSQILASMRCLEGSWDYVAICQPDCGRETPRGDALIIDGRRAERGEFPWHAGIYRTNVQPYMQVCGGSIISTTIVISAAHCFWSDLRKLLPPTLFAVAAGKLYRPWGDTNDADAQKSNVSDIKIPVRFLGEQTNFQDDIALVILSTAFEYQPYVRPVCIDFDYQFDRRQLVPGNIGKVAGWGLTAEDGGASQVLKVVDLPYVDINRCLVEAPPGFREYITSDKICAGYNNGTALCKGDSGGGLAFPETERGSKRYYLRGIVSVAPKNDNKCNAYALTSFTQIMAHEHFIKEHFGGAFF